MIKIDCYMSMRCGSEELLRANISEALRLEGIQAEVNFKRITDAEAETLGLRGSPSVIVNGTEVQPIEGVGLGGFA